MTLPTAPRRPRRWGLYGPFIALAIAVIVWSGVWLWLSGAVSHRLDEASAATTRTGGTLTWSGRRISGYPFRIDVDFTGLSWRGPSGWGVSAPTLQTEAFAFDPGHWMAMAPAGLVFTRPEGGAVKVSARVLRASASDLSAHPIRFSLQALDLTFTPAPGAAPWFLDGAHEIDIHTRAGPADQGAFYVGVDKAAARPASALGRIAAGQPVNFVIDATYSHAAALAGPTWAGAVADWAREGGTLNVRRVSLRAGAAGLDAHGDGLTVGQDGRLEGVLDATLIQAPRALAALAAGGVVDPRAAALALGVVAAERAGGADHVSLDFQAGRTTLGPVGLGPAPKVY